MSRLLVINFCIFGRVLSEIRLKYISAVDLNSRKKNLCKRLLPESLFPVKEALVVIFRFQKIIGNFFSPSNYLFLYSQCSACRKLFQFFFVWFAQCVELLTSKHKITIKKSYTLPSDEKLVSICPELFSNKLSITYDRRLFWRITKSS